MFVVYEAMANRDPLHQGYVRSRLILQLLAIELAK